jgi:hypothetical protein
MICTCRASVRQFSVRNSERDVLSARDRATSLSRLSTLTGCDLDWDVSFPFASSCIVQTLFLNSAEGSENMRYVSPIKPQWRKLLERYYIPPLRTQEVIVDRNRLRPGQPDCLSTFHLPRCCVKMPRLYKRRGETSEDPHLACIAPHLTRAHHSTTMMSTILFSNNIAPASLVSQPSMAPDLSLRTMTAASAGVAATSEGWTEQTEEREPRAARGDVLPSSAFRGDDDDARYMHVGR